MNLATLGLVSGAVVLNTAAQFVLKAGTEVLAEDTKLDLLARLLATALSPYILAGLGLYVASFALWIVVLSRLEVSVAYPMLSLGYVLAAVVAYIWLGEALTPSKVAGIGCVIAGVYLLSMSHASAQDQPHSSATKHPTAPTARRETNRM
jgi:multidrug transporter EmrE-like cation transporter